MTAAISNPNHETRLRGLEARTTIMEDTLGEIRDLHLHTDQRVDVVTQEVSTIKTDLEITRDRETQCAELRLRWSASLGTS